MKNTCMRQIISDELFNSVNKPLEQSKFLYHCTFNLLYGLISVRLYSKFCDKVPILIVHQPTKLLIMVWKCCFFHWWRSLPILQSFSSNIPNKKTVADIYRPVILDIKSF